MNDFKTNKQGVSLQCSQCGGSLRFDPKTQMLVCEICGSSFHESEFMQGNASPEKKVGDDGVMHYHCPSCGAEVEGDENLASGFCPYCGNPVIFDGRLNGELKPNLIIPFTIDKESAKETLRKYLKGFKYVPSSFLKEANLNRITGIYYPFWEADIDTNSSMVAEGQTVSSWTVGDTEYTETRYYEVFRRGIIHFEDISVNALKNADKNLIESVLPYPIEAHEDFKAQYLAGFYSKKNDLLYDDVVGEIRGKLEDYSRRILLKTVNGYNGGLRVINSKADVFNKSHDYTFLPVWEITYKYRGKEYTYAVNGATGKAFGKVPVSRPKLCLTFGAVVAGFFAVLSFVGGLLI